MSLLDWVVVGAAVALAISGYVEGFVVGACATLGLLGGAALGVWGVPKALDHFSPSVTVSFVALLLVVALAAFGRWRAAVIGAWLRNKMSWRPVRFLDALAGAALAAASALIVAWVLGVAVSGARIPSVTSAVRGSEVLAKVDEVLPRQHILSFTKRLPGLTRGREDRGGQFSALPWLPGKPAKVIRQD